MSVRVPVSAFTLFIVLGSVCSAQSTGSVSILTRVGDYVERYYTRAQTVVARELVVIQPITRDMASVGFPRRVVNELRLEWDPFDPQPRVVRELVDAKGPTLGPPDQPDCLDPRAFTPEPLAFLLPSRREKFRFMLGSRDTVAGVRTQRIEYVPVAPEPFKVEWNGQCGAIDLPGRTRGRVWVDPATGEVLRFDEHLIGIVDLPGPKGPQHRDAPLWFTVERSDTTIEYQRVSFRDPEETLLLPSRVESISMIRNSGVPRLRVVQTFSNYRRFLTTGRALPIRTSPPDSQPSTPAREGTTLPNEP